MNTNNKSYSLTYLRKIIIITLITFTVSSFQSKALIVFMNYAVFKMDNVSSYVELYLKVPISTINIYQKENKSFEASLSVEIKYSQGDSIASHNKFTLVSPEIADTSNTNFALLELIRIQLKYGIYKLDINITDDNDPDNNTSFSTIVNTKFDNNIIKCSSILFADTFYNTTKQNKFSRNKIDIIPNVFNSYSYTQKDIFFYIEYYNSNKIIKEDIIFVKYYIKSNSLILSDKEQVIRQKPMETNFVYGKLDINNLSEGEYNLVVEIYNHKNRILASRSAYFYKQPIDFLFTQAQSSIDLFSRIVGDYRKEKLKKYIDYLINIADREEMSTIENIIEENDSVAMETFFNEFWLKRNNKDPGKAWFNYLTKIEECNKMFNTQFRKGYLTERGRVYLDYGPPNSVVESTNASISYPYQIWHYHDLPPNQSNKKFVFFNKTGTLNEYELIYSDAIGEVKFENWKEIINKYNSTGNVFGDFLDEDF